MGRRRAAPRHSRLPTRRTVELLGLEARAKLPPASAVILTKHALDRYRLRVENVPRAAAKVALRELMAGAKVRHERPRCMGPERAWERQYTTVGYVICDRRQPAIVLPVVMSGGRPVAVTCIVTNN